MSDKKSPKPLLGKIACYESTAEARAPLAEFFSSKEFLRGEAKRKASFFARKGCDLLCSAEDFAAQCSFSSLEHPEKNESEIIALVVTQALQGRSRSAIATIFLDLEPREGEAKFEIEANEPAEIEQWRLASDDQLTSQVEHAEANDLFGRESVSQAILREGAE
jgi:organic radical activating enzyme